MSYHVTGQVETMIDPLGHVTKFGYDSAGRSVSVTGAFGLAEAMTATQSYDVAGRPSISIAPGGLQTKTDYTPFSEVAFVTEAYGDTLARTTQFGYDASGNRTLTMDPLNNISSTSYDKRNLPTSFTDAEGGITTQAYDAAGRRLSITDPVNNKTQYSYFANDTLQAVTDPLGKVTSFTYYADDMVQQKTDRLGRTSDYVYDKNARLVSEVWKDNGGVTVDTRSFSYDVAGNLLTASNNAGAYGFTYDALNRVSTVTQPFGLTLTNVYDAGDNRLTVTDNKGGVTTSTYDGLNRLSSRELSGTGITPLKAIWDYDAAGNVSKLTRQTNVVTVGTADTSHDILHRTTEIHHKNAVGVTLGKYEYTSYDAGDRLLSQTIDGVVTNYAYDKTNQLTQDGGTSYSYDANGNRTNGSYTVGPNNQIIMDGTWTYSYDNASQTSSKSDGVTAWNYNYDHNGQMIEAGNGFDTVEYTYDVFGNRIERSHDDGTSVDVERFAFDGGDTAKPRPIGNEQFDTYADLDASNNVTMRRMYGGGFDELVVRRDAAGNEGWYLTDKLNSVRAIADDAGTVVATATYSAFGESVTTGAIDRFQYTSQERDLQLGLDYSNARMRDPVTSMFLNEDPMSFAAGDPNLRRYVRNGATNSSDPSGLFDPLGWAGRRVDGVQNAVANTQSYAAGVADSHDLTTLSYMIDTPGAAGTDFAHGANYGSARMLRQITYDNMRSANEHIAKHEHEYSPAVNTTIDISGMVTRESLIGIGTAGTGNVARGGTFVTGQAIKHSPKVVRGAEYVYGTLMARDAALTVDSLIQAEAARQKGDMVGSYGYTALFLLELLILRKGVQADLEEPLKQVCIPSSKVIGKADTLPDAAKTADAKPMVASPSSKLAKPALDSRIPLPIVKAPPDTIRNQGILDPHNNKPSMQAELFERDRNAVQFGQKRIGENFRQYSEAPDFIRGRSVADVAADLRAGRISPDSLPVHYFEHKGQLVAINNRGLAALAEAGMRPTVLRRVPREQVPQKYLERLDEEPIVREQTIPGCMIPVTEDEAGTQIIRIIELP